MKVDTRVERLGNCCNVLRDEGMRYGDYFEQFTPLLFLEAAYGCIRPPYSQPSPVPAAYAWPKLRRVIVDRVDAQVLRAVAF